MEITPRRIPRVRLLHFCRQFSVFLRAGLPITSGLELLASQESCRPLRSFALELATALRAGSSFTDAAVAQRGAFAPYQLGMLRAAELTGRLDEVLDQIAEYIERDLDARSRILAALLYPGVVLVASVMTVVVMATFVLPRFKSFFASFHAKLPLPTRMLMSACDFVSSHWSAILLGSGALVILVALALRTSLGRSICGRAVLRVPVVGPLVAYAIAERTCRILAAMLHAGVLLADALVVAASATSNAVYRHGLSTVRAQMLQGKGLAQPVAETKLFDGPTRQIFRIGESTGTLDEQLERAAAYYDRELGYRLKRFTALFEPAVILFVGLIVGFVAVALISAIYGIYSQMRV